MIEKKDFLKELKNNILKEKKAIFEIKSLFNHIENTKTPSEKNMVLSQMGLLKKSLQNTNKDIISNLEKISLVKSLIKHKKEHAPEIKLEPQASKYESRPVPVEKPIIQYIKTEDSHLSKLEAETLKRLTKKEKKVVKKKSYKPSKYVGRSNKLFSKLSSSWVKNSFFRTLGRDLIKAKMQFTPISYISTILFTTMLSIAGGFFIFLFFLFFNVGSTLPLISMVDEGIGPRFIKVFWILFAVPLGTFFLMYFYPSLEKKSAGIKVDQELPFATIHMAAISGSMVEPSKIFSIIVSTGEYPSLEKELIRLMNEINVYGHDLATALRNVAFNSPSMKLAELLNGLATTINSGGDLPEFFEKRSQTLLFEHKISKEKHTKTAETFMDIYISVVIAAPMILMLLLIMMSVSGLSWISTSMITIIMIMGVSIANVIFLTFLHLKSSTE